MSDRLPYEGDSFLSYDPEVLEIERRARAARSAYVQQLVKTWLSKVNAWLTKLGHADRDRYLNQATDIADLERRLKQLEHRHPGLLT